MDIRLRPDRRHRGRLGAALAFLSVLAVAGCGTEQAGSATHAGTRTSATPATPATPSPAATADHLCPGETALPPTATATSDIPDMAPHYAENHAFQQPAKLHGDVRCKALADAARTEQALKRLVAEDGAAVGEAAVRSTLLGLGYDKDAVAITSDNSGFITATVTLTPVCIDVEVERTLTKAEAHGVYLEGSGCVRPEGGH